MSFTSFQKNGIGGGDWTLSIFFIVGIVLTLDMHPLAAVSRSRLLEREPKLFVFETSYYAFCGRYCFLDSSAHV